jgi:hypothetical protein
MIIEIPVSKIDSSVESFTTPILFLIFNRPSQTQKVFESIQAIRPKFLFVAADGPRENNIHDQEKCKMTRAIIKQIDWECEVKTLFREKNLGCGRAVSSAVTWFFEHVEKGIILEDDCLPITDFFYYCESLLIKYKNDNSIMHIGGRNNLTVKLKYRYSYYYSAYTHIWGWATWKRAWDFYNFKIGSLNNFEDSLTFYFKKKFIRDYWIAMFQQFRINPIDTWDYQWTYTVWKNKGLSILPVVNLVTNIGFGNDATHTKTDSSSKFTKVSSIHLPLVSACRKKIFFNADKLYFHFLILPIPTIIDKVKFKLNKMRRRFFSN